MLQKAGFNKMKFYGSLKLAKFEVNSSGDLVVITKT